MRQQLQNLIISGSSKEQILSVTGISAEAFQEFLDDKEFHAEIRTIREAQRETEIDKEYSKLELNAIKAVNDNITLYDATSLCRVMETVARTRQLKRAGPVVTPSNGMLNQTIAINLPVFLGNSHVIMDSKKQVVAIDGRNMTPLPTAQVRRLFTELERTGNENEDPILADLAAIEAARANSQATAIGG